MPTGIGIVDLMLGVPSNRDDWSASFGSLVKDTESKGFGHGAGYMFKDLPQVDGTVDYIAYLLAEMDRWGIEKGLLPVAFGDEYGSRGVAEHPDRLYGSYLVDPNQGMTDVRNLERAVRELGVIAAACFPSGTNPQQRINAALMYPFYAKCCELDIPMCINAGVPGPRFPFDPQHVEHLDVVCYDFPDLKLVSRHGAEPWDRLMMKLMLKWPNLYYSTSAFAPKYYPQSIIDYANTRGADKVMYAGYFPSGLSLERIITEMDGVAFRDEVWPKFLRENALRVFKMA
ncbi:MAG: amidohydrolase family protein [Acidimicrobiales bacterium]|nr:amidohydrolase family protein [Acidimicrobiales bacterium]